MTIKKTVLSTLFVSAMAFAGSTQAQESHVEQMINQMLNVAMTQVAAEINEEVEASILVATSNFDFAKVQDPTLPATTVTITDIATVTPKVDVNLTEQSDD
ncbi:hypothetical protein ISG33_16370 [Glaciecola sp. MH2013]|uniref:hypothetical protein n=1 Tax=Glaciecola sp. MH2013 TaxID=2785524 RepID=UPI00189FB22D|nr:hypothetical protein [Glaciecola sp. MH2013]MBF7074977.1 hypothetical protein [Glaciecola sp. MH2013]